MPVCQNCQQSFTICPEDREFYQRINVPEPTFCPDCRQQRRLVWRNYFHLYLRKCNLCKKKLLAAIRLISHSQFIVQIVGGQTGGIQIVIIAFFHKTVSTLIIFGFAMTAVIALIAFIVLIITSQLIVNFVFVGRNSPILMIVILVVGRPILFMKE